MLDAAGGRPATVYGLEDGSVAYFAPNAENFCEAGELKEAELAAAQRVLVERGVSDMVPLACG